MRYCKAFTLIEIMIVLVVLSVMAGFAVPNMIKVKEKAQFSEGVQALQALHAAQLRYNVKGVVGAYADDCTKLDIDVSVKADKWSEVECRTNGSVRATWRTVSSGAPDFRLQVDPSGAFYCISGSNCLPIDCSRLTNFAYLWGLCPGECIAPENNGGAQQAGCG